MPPTRQNVTSRVTYSTDAETVERLKRQALRAGRSDSAMFRTCVDLRDEIVSAANDIPPDERTAPMRLAILPAGVPVPPGAMVVRVHLPDLAAPEPARELLRPAVVKPRAPKETTRPVHLGRPIPQIGTDEEEAESAAFNALTTTEQVIAYHEAQAGRTACGLVVAPDLVRQALSDAVTCPLCRATGAA